MIRLFHRMAYAVLAANIAGCAGGPAFLLKQDQEFRNSKDEPLFLIMQSPPPDGRMPACPPQQRERQPVACGWLDQATQILRHHPGHSAMEHDVNNVVIALSMEKIAYNSGCPSGESSGLGAAYCNDLTGHFEQILLRPPNLASVAVLPRAMQGMTASARP